MEDWLAQIAPQAPYIAIVGVLLISGFGVPIPEDIPIIIGGILCGRDAANAWIALPAIFLAIIGADGIIFCLGRRYGHHVPKLPLLRRFLTEQRLARTEAMLHRHGGKFIFMARFLPGLRTAAFFTAGVFKIPAWKFFCYDGAAALLSVPVIFYLGYFFAYQYETVREWVKDGQIVAMTLGLLLIAGFVLVKRVFKRRIVAPGNV